MTLHVALFGASATLAQDGFVLDDTTVSADDVLAAVASTWVDLGCFGPACDRVCQAARASVGAEVAVVATQLDGALEKR